METLVPGRMVRAGLLLLPLLLCFGLRDCQTAINLTALRDIVDHVDKYGFTTEYAFAVSLNKSYCQNATDIKAVLPLDELRAMQAAINEGDRLYNPSQGNIVAAAVPNKPREHAERRLLQGDQDSPVSKLLARTSRENNNNICLIFFTLNSPCVGKCLNDKTQYNILQPVSDIFGSIRDNYKAFVFQKIWYERNETRESLLKAWHQMKNVPLYRCDNTGCKDCFGNNPDACMYGM
ncbi:uncharacterized protein LOC123350670 [Mauremys mutica]|uniref:uncharacterized protein LOC123350670 n=1 Tax=Mauremys mutica TaxID=74926 RepID=UPI001D16354E|nr:uncharacterized protein LOC123350670 [Mauremys mutica]